MSFLFHLFNALEKSVVSMTIVTLQLDHYTLIKTEIKQNNKIIFNYSKILKIYKIKKCINK